MAKGVYTVQEGNEHPKPDSSFYACTTALLIFLILIIIITVPLVYHKISDTSNLKRAPTEETPKNEKVAGYERHAGLETTGETEIPPVLTGEESTSVRTPEETTASSITANETTGDASTSSQTTPKNENYTLGRILQDILQYILSITLFIDETTTPSDLIGTTQNNSDITTTEIYSENDNDTVVSTSSISYENHTDTTLPIIGKLNVTISSVPVE